jgi:hypothetical protein
MGSKHSSVLDGNVELRIRRAIEGFVRHVLDQNAAYDLPFILHFSLHLQPNLASQHLAKIPSHKVEAEAGLH